MEMTPLITVMLLESLVLLIFIFFLVHKGRHKISNYALAFFFFTQLLGINAYIPFSQLQFFKEHLPQAFFVGLPFALLWAPSFYYYVLLTTGGKPWKTVYLIHTIPFLIYGTYFLFNYRLLPTDEKIFALDNVLQSVLFRYLNHVIDAQVILYNIMALRLLYNFKKMVGSGRLMLYDKQNFQWLTYITYGYIFTCFIDDAVLTQLQHWVTLDSYLVSAIVFFVFFTVLFYKGITSQEVFIGQPVAEKYKASRLDEKEARAMVEKLDRYIRTEKPFCRPNLTLKELSGELQVQERHLSQVINTYKEQGFYDFINHLRIQEAKKLLTDKTNRYNVLQILYEVGFNSKTAFNRAFKKHTGLTPSLFKRRFSNSDANIIA